MSEVALIVAVATTGLTAGIFLGFSIAVMPALARVGDRAFVDVMQNINSAIQNGVFGLVFLGAPASNAIAAWRYADQDEVFRWTVAGLVGYLATLTITFTINIPLNNRLDQAGSADPGGPRASFERAWVLWHNIRTITCVAAFGCLAVALHAAG